MSAFRYGNIVYYEDVPDCGYPICFNKKYWSEERFKQASFDKPLFNNGVRDVFIRPLEFRVKEFWEQNTHLKCIDSDVPESIIHIHDFQNWYEDTYGEQAEIFQGDSCINKPHFDEITR